MEKFTIHEGVAVPLDSANIDTDQIIPKQFLLAVSRKGFGVHLFHDWRYLDDAETQPNPEFNLNKPEFKGASILVARDNFGNGSSREHAPWALMDYGIKAVIAPSFAVIFNNNALGNGLLTVKLTVEEVDEIFKELAKNPGSKKPPSDLSEERPSLCPLCDNISILFSRSLVIGRDLPLFCHFVGRSFPFHSPTTPSSRSISPTGTAHRRTAITSMAWSRRR